MKHYVSLLRGINVAGKKKILMTDLKVLYESIGLTQVQTYIQSGNVVFASLRCAESVQKAIVAAIEKQYNFEVPVLVLTQSQIAQAIKKSPFADKDEKYHYLSYLSEKSDVSLIPFLEKAVTQDEEYEVIGSIVYLFCPNGYGKTKFTNGFVEKQLKVNATTRNWRTSNKILSLFHWTTTTQNDLKANR